MKKFIKNLGGCIPFRRRRKKKHSSSFKVYLPARKEDVNPKTATKIPLSDNLLAEMNKHNKKLIIDSSFIELIEKIKSIIKQDFSAQSLASGLNGKDGSFRVLTTRLKAVEEIKDPFFKEKVFPYLDKQLLTLDQENDKNLIRVLTKENIIAADGIIKLRHLGDYRIYDIGLSKLGPQHVDQLKTNLFTALDTLQDLIRSHPSYPLTESQTSVESHLSDQSTKLQTSIKPRDDSKSASGLDQSQEQESIKTPKIGLAFLIHYVSKTQQMHKSKVALYHHVYHKKRVDLSIENKPKKRRERKIIYLGTKLKS